MKMWKQAFTPIMVILFAVCLTALTGCAALDWFFGYDAAQPDSQNDSAPSDDVGGLVGVLPYGQYVIAGLGILRWAYIEFRKRQLDSAFKSVVVGIKEAVSAANGQPLDKDALYQSITGASRLYANREVFSQLVDKIKKEYEIAKAQS